jgi:hypothetical protein
MNYRKRYKEIRSKAHLYPQAYAIDKVFAELKAEEAIDKIFSKAPLTSTGK